MSDLEIIQSKELKDSSKLEALLAMHNVTPERLHFAFNKIGGFNARQISLLEIRGYIKKGFFPMRYYSALSTMLRIQIGGQEDNDLVDVLNRVSKANGAEVDIKFIERVTNGLENEAAPKNGYVGEWLLIIMNLGGMSVDDMAEKMGTYPAVVNAVIDGKVLLGKRCLMRLKSVTMGYMPGAVEALEKRLQKDEERFQKLSGALGILCVELGNVSNDSEFMPIYAKLLKEYPEHFDLKKAAELNGLSFDNLKNALKNYSRRGSVNHTASALSIDTLNKMATALACDVNKQEKYNWIASILIDIGMKKLPRKSLDRLTADFFEHEGKPDPSSITDDPVRIAMESKRLARAFGAKGYKEWHLENNQHFLRDAGFGALAEKASVGFFKMGSIAIGFSQERLAYFRNPDGSKLGRAAYLELQALVNGNPTIPAANDIADEARELLNCLMNNEPAPENNFVAAWMRSLHEKHPDGKFVDAHNKLNMYRVTNAVTDMLMSRYAFDLKKTWPAYFRYINPIRKGERDVCIFPDSRSHNESPYMALVMAEPFKHDSKLHDKLALLFLMITERKEPEELLEEVVMGTISTAQMHKRLRLQGFQEIKTYALDVCKNMDLSQADFDQRHKRLANMLCRLEGEQGCTNDAEYAAALARRWFPVNGEVFGKNAKLRDAAECAFLGKRINLGNEQVTLEELKTYVAESVEDHSKTWAGFVSRLQKYLQCDSYNDIEAKSKGVIAAYRVKPWLNGVTLDDTRDADILLWLNKTLACNGNPMLRNAIKHLACNTRKIVSEEAVELIESTEAMTPDQASGLLAHLRQASKMKLWQIEDAAGLRRCEYSPIENSGIVAVYKRRADKPDMQRSEHAAFRLAQTLIHERYPNRDALCLRMEQKMLGLLESMQKGAPEGELHGRP